MDGTIVALLGIGVFALGCVAGYITGWGHGTMRGFDVGWAESQKSVRRQIEVMKQNRQ